MQGRCGYQYIALLNMKTTRVLSILIDVVIYVSLPGMMSCDKVNVLSKPYFSLFDFLFFLCCIMGLSDINVFVMR